MGVECLYLACIGQLTRTEPRIVYHNQFLRTDEMLVPIREALRCLRDYTLPMAYSVRVGFARGRCSSPHSSSLSSSYPLQSRSLHDSELLCERLTQIIYRYSRTHTVAMAPSRDSSDNMTSHSSWGPRPLAQIPSITIFDPSELEYSLPSLPYTLFRTDSLRKIHKEISRVQKHLHKLL